MLIYMGFDDTDAVDAPMGTGRLARLFADGLDRADCSVVGVLRHQLPRLDGIPYTSNNSSACVVVRVRDDSGVPEGLVDAAVAHLDRYADEEGDPGLCVLSERETTPELVAFAVAATTTKFTQRQAMEATPKGRLWGLGGDNGGVIGAAAAVGLTRYGWCGRFIEYGDMRSLSEPVTVADLNGCGVRVMSTDRDPVVPRPSDRVVSGGWIRPSAMAGEPVLQVAAREPGVWAAVHTKRKKKTKAA